jgi:hypothetical protein
MRLLAVLVSYACLCSACAQSGMHDAPPIADPDDDERGRDASTDQKPRADAAGTRPKDASQDGERTPADGGTAQDPGDPTALDAAQTGADDGLVPDASGPAQPPTAKPQLAVSADFLNKTLTVFDVGKLAVGAKRADVMVASVDLSAFTPGPMSLAIAPNGKTAIVSISGGFLSSFITVPAGDGTLVFVDLQTYTVAGALFTGKSPMGIVFSPDSKRAFVGHLSEDYLAVVDVEARTFTKLSTGAAYNEELAIDDTGTVAVMSYGTSGNVKTFSVADPTASLGQTSGLSGDAAGVAFFPGTKVAYLMQAPTVLTLNVGGHNLIDVSDPKKPVSSDNTRSGGFPTVYPVTAVPSRNSVAYPSTSDNKLSVVEVKLENGKAVKGTPIEIGSAASLAYGVTSTPDGRVLVASSGEHYIGVADLASRQAYTVPWEVTESGPTEVKLIP